MQRSRAIAAAASWISLAAIATPLTQHEIVALCGNAEDAAHCGRLIYSTAGESTRFIVLRRTTNRRFDLPAEPRLSPDRSHIVTADMCPIRCINEIAAWRVSPESLRKELAWTPGERWSDAAATWKDENTLAIEYTAAGADKAAIVERKLADPVWKRVTPE